MNHLNKRALTALYCQHLLSDECGPVVYREQLFAVGGQVGYVLVLTLTGGYVHLPIGWWTRFFLGHFVLSL